jgi:hypothetical protein
VRSDACQRRRGTIEHCSRAGLVARAAPQSAP